MDRPNRIPWPPLIEVGILATAAVLEAWGPKLPLWPESLVVRWLGWALVLIGVGTAIAGLMQFRAEDTTPNPAGRASALAVGGVYRFTRNPMYLGVLIAFLGLALAWRSAWLLVLLPPMAYALTKLAIEREEAYLEHRFGDAYRDYKSRTRRWI